MSVHPSQSQCDDVNRGMRSIQSIQSYKLSVKNSHLNQINSIRVEQYWETLCRPSPWTWVFALTTILKFPIVVNILSKYLALMGVGTQAGQANNSHQIKNAVRIGNYCLHTRDLWNLGRSELSFTRRCLNWKCLVRRDLMSFSLGFNKNQA